MKRKVLIGVTAFLLCLITAIPAMAQKVYYNGTPVNWDYGRKLAVYSYSDVQTGVYDHSATANSNFSGWKRPGVLAHAQDLIGTGTVTVYWNCR